MTRAYIAAALAVIVAVVAVGWIAFFALFGAGGRLASSPIEIAFCWLAALAILTFTAIYGVIPDRRKGHRS